MNENEIHIKSIELDFERKKSKIDFVYQGKGYTYTDSPGNPLHHSKIEVNEKIVNLPDVSPNGDIKVRMQLLYAVAILVADGSMNALS